MATHGGSRPGAGRKKQDVTKTRDAKIAEALEFRSNMLQPVSMARARAADATIAAGNPLVNQFGVPFIQEGKFRDYAVNYGARLGLGAQNDITSTVESQTFLSRIRTRLEWMYAEQFVCKNAIDVVAEDMTREGVRITGPMKPKDIRKIEALAMQMNLWTRMRSLIKWARLYGGAVGFIQIDGQRPDTPLRLETVAEGQFKGIVVFDRWMIDPSLEDLVTDMSSPQLGMPRFYRVTADAPAMPRIKMHYSRCIRLIGNEQPYWRAVQENMWGISILETIQDRIHAFDLGSMGAAELINKSFIRTFKVEGLKELIGSNAEAFQGLQALVAVMTAMQGIQGVTLMDLKDEYEGHEHGAFSGLAEILTEFRQQLSGALQIPQTKLFGTSPAGMNATGESDIRGYYDLIRARQVSDIGYSAHILYQLLAQSSGVKWKDDYGVEFKRLWQPTEKEKAEIAKTITETVLAAEEKGTISTQTAMEELKQQSYETGVWTNIKQEDIDSAMDVPVPAANVVMPGTEGVPNDPPKPPAPGGAKPPGGGKPAPKPAAKPAAKPAKAKDSAWGHKVRTFMNTVFGGGDLSVVPGGYAAMPSGVQPGARPFEDGAPTQADKSNEGSVDTVYEGLPIHIETYAGQLRMSSDPRNPWIARLATDYGYIVGTGSAEGPHEGMDVFVSNGEKCYAINQGKMEHADDFDEVKFMLGFKNKSAAIAAYIASHNDPIAASNRILSIDKVSVEDIKEFLNGDQSKPFRDSWLGQTELSKVDEPTLKAGLQHTLQMTGDPDASMDPTVTENYANRGVHGPN